MTGDAIQANRKRDFTSARVASDIDAGKGELAVPLKADYNKAMIDDKEEILFTGRGVVLTTFFSWRDDKTPKAKEALQLYCQYLSMHRYGATADEIWREIESKDKDDGANWIKATYGKYVNDAADIIRYLLPNL